MPVADVAREREGPAAEALLDLCRDRFACVQLAAGDDDVGAVLSERHDHLPSQAAAATGHQRHPAVQIEQRIHGNHAPSMRVPARPNNDKVIACRCSPTARSAFPAHARAYVPSRTIPSFKHASTTYQAIADRSRADRSA